MKTFLKMLLGKRVPKSPVKVICFDFDGVIHSYESGWRGVNVIPDLPVMGSKEILRSLVLTEDVKVVIFSARNKSLRGRKAMRKYLLERVGLCSHIVSQIRFPWFKPAYHIMLDDRGLMFEGKYPSIDTILDFIPWNKRPPVTCKIC